MTFCRHWPVVVMGMSDLPSSIACGACALQPGSGFPLSLAEASSKGRAEEAYPVLVLGTQVNLDPMQLLQGPAALIVGLNTAHNNHHHHHCKNSCHLLGSCAPMVCGEAESAYRTVPCHTKSRSGTSDAAGGISWPTLNAWHWGCRAWGGWRQDPAGGTASQRVTQHWRHCPPTPTTRGRCPRCGPTHAATSSVRRR